MPGHTDEDLNIIYVHRQSPWDIQKVYIKVCMYILIEYQYQQGLPIDRTALLDRSIIDEIRSIFVQYGAVHQIEVNYLFAPFVYRRLPQIHVVYHL